MAFLAVAPFLRAQDTVSISDPAEFNAYQVAVSQADPQSKAAGLEHFLNRYPQSVVRNVVLDTLLDTYRSMGDATHVLSAAARLLQADPNNLKAIYISVYIKKTQCEKNQDAQSCNDAAALAQKGLAATKGAGVSDVDWGRQTAAAYPLFRSAIAKVGGTVQLQATGSSTSDNHRQEAIASAPNSSVRLRPEEFSQIIAAAENVRAKAAQGTTPDCVDPVASLNACHEIEGGESVQCNLLEHYRRAICAESLKIFIMEGGLKSVERALDQKDPIAALAYYEAVRGGTSKVGSIGRTLAISSGQSTYLGAQIISPESISRASSQGEAMATSGEFPFVSEYLERTKELYFNLWDYRDSTIRLQHLPNKSLDEALFMLRETIKFQKSLASQLGDTSALQAEINAQSTALRQRLDSVPQLQIDETAYEIPQQFAGTTPANARAKYAFLLDKLTELNLKLASSPDLRNASNVSSGMLGELFGAETKSSFESKTIALSEAKKIHERLREELAMAVAEAFKPIAPRALFAEALTSRMSGQIVWCAAGQSGEILAGYATTSYLSKGTESLIATGSPLYMELYQKGFRFIGIFDRDEDTKTAALTQHGAVTASLMNITDQQRAYLTNATDVLMRVANNVDASSYRLKVEGQEVTDCIPMSVPDSCAEGEVRNFMPGVGSICTKR
jgi:hypothetical protein